MGGSIACSRCEETDAEAQADSYADPTTDFQSDQSNPQATFAHIQQLVKASSPDTLVDEQCQVEAPFVARKQHSMDECQPSRPLCFTARCHQLTHPAKRRADHKDADVTLASPMLLAVADGVSQLEEFGIDPTELPNELLRMCEELATEKLIPDRLSAANSIFCSRDAGKGVSYSGPVALLRDAFESTSSLGSMTVLLGIMDNSTVIHGRVHPMIAVLTIGDCELLMLRRLDEHEGQLVAVFHTEVQRDKDRIQTPLELARVDSRVDPEYDETISLQVIERGSRVQCTSAYEGDIVVMGTDGVFDNLFLEEIIQICNEFLPPSQPGPFIPLLPATLSTIAQHIVKMSHSKTQHMPSGHVRETPIGPGGKVDDTAVVVAEIVEWTGARRDRESERQRQRQWDQMSSCACR